MIFSYFRYAIVLLIIFLNFSNAIEVLEEGPKNQIGDIIIKQVWIRPSRLENSAAYMIIENKGSVLDQLKNAETSACEHVELHRIEEINGVFHMKKVDVIDIPAGSSTILKPGGMHVMLMRLRRPMKVGEQVDLKLVFAKAGTITLQGHIKLNNNANVKRKDHEVEELNLGIH